MAEPACQTRNEFGSGTVRRLIARPIRIDLTRPSPRSAGWAQDLLDRDAAAEQREREAEVERLRTEVEVMKAVLASERRETARLRACLGLDDAADPATDEVRAVRDRWATLVDRILRAPC